MHVGGGIMMPHHDAVARSETAQPRQPNRGGPTETRLADDDATGVSCRAGGGCDADRLGPKGRGRRRRPRDVEWSAFAINDLT